MKSIFSIITPTYNRGYVLWKTIQSAQKQTYPFWELLIIDDGSSDNTRQVVAEFKKDPRIKYLKQSHKGAAQARNFGLKIAKGEIITYLDSDDYFYENYLTTALEYFKKYPKKIFAICNYNRRLELYDKNFNLVDFKEESSAQKLDITLQDYYHWKVKTCGTGIFHKRIISKKIKWDKKFKMLEDLDFILQLGNHYPNGFIHISFALFEYLQKYGGDALCSNISYKDMAKSFSDIYIKHKNDPFIKGQAWYPQRVEKYTKLQEEFEEGKAVAPEFRYFPKYYKKNSP